MKFDLISSKQSDNRNKDDYTTKYDKSNTYRVKYNGKFFIIRINYYQNNHNSSSPIDRSLHFLTPDGWKLLGTSYNINQKRFPTSDQYDCRIKGIVENCDLWIESCKEYFEEISIVL